MSVKRNSKCRCRWCAWGRRIRRLNNQITPAVGKLIEELYTVAINEASDAEYYKLRLEGKWPNTKG